MYNHMLYSICNQKGVELMEDIMELAREIVIRTYGNNPCIAIVRGTCRRWDSRKMGDRTISCGMFRQTIIPNSHQFVIKTGMVQGGNRQCRRELTFYKEAVKAGLGQYFAKCYGTFRCGSCTFYVYEYVDGIGEGNGDATEYIDNDDLQDFLDEHEIGDLHFENYALTEDNQIVLTDYSGYWGNDTVGMRTISWSY